MKVIVTGATGRAGKVVVNNCLDNDRITKVVILTRTGISGDIESHPKVDLVMHQDFTQYSDYLIQRLQGAEACIWAIGVRPEQAKSDKLMHRSIGVDLPIMAANILCEKLADKTPNGAKFRFVYCSPKHTEKSKKTLMFATDTRKLANDLEKGIGDVVHAHKSSFEAYTLRPASFAVSDHPQPAATPTPTSKKLVHGLGNSSATFIEPSRVGKAMVMIACDGWKEKVIENESILKLSG
ncbi:hypothetical protein QQS21_011988 [Conoideocrella luteorostrata]|uniref:NAD(P)-binding domain-containing protein n=1 Tax=Conoideocrella luteorostrata TaxID=1105319 RepID=A0AAJ0CCA1_9HYPO|nr:hypothetical protein QQS21_011988 [Conoideocrella luteorostrata]